MKLCECGCGEAVTVFRNRSRRYINGHNSKGTNNPFYGKKHKPETKKKISDALSGEKGIWYGMAGKNHPSYGTYRSDENKQKRSEASKGKKNPFYGKKHTPKSRKKISIAGKGRKHTPETCQKMSKSRSGEKHPNWQGGKSSEPYGKEFNKKLKNEIRKRDGNKCQLCSKRKYKKELAVHHIDYDKKNNEPTNLISLCRNPCHSRTNGNRKYWEKYFKNVMKKKYKTVSQERLKNKLDLK